MKTKYEFCLDEEWKKIYNGYYAVSDWGRVKSLKAALNSKKISYGYIKKQSKDQQGYLQVGLYIDGKEIRRRVHRLVAKAFLGPCPKGKQVNHIDGAKQNNCAENLEYVTPKENMEHAAKLGLFNPQGSNSPNAKLDEGQVLKIRKMIRKKKTHSSIAKRFNVSRPTISMIASRKIWKHI